MKGGGLRYLRVKSNRYLQGIVRGLEIGQLHGMDFEGQGKQLNVLVFRLLTGLLPNLSWKAGFLSKF